MDIISLTLAKAYTDEKADEKADKVEVTSADNGKFMQVVNGEWAAVTVPNANGVSF